jgi:MFS family permease
MAMNGVLANTMLQLQAPDELRGRVMGFYSFVVLGMAPFGAVQVGWVSEHYGARAAFTLGGAACVVIAGIVGWAVRADRRTGGRAEGGEWGPRSAERRDGGTAEGAGGGPPVMRSDRDDSR